MFFPLSTLPCLSIVFANDSSAQECPNGKKRMQLLMARADTISEHSWGATPRAVIFQRKRMSLAGRQKADKQCAQRIVVKRMQVNGQCLQWVRKLLTQHPNLDKMRRLEERKRWKETRKRMEDGIQKSRDRGMNRLMQYHILHRKREANCSTRLKTYLCMHIYV